MATKENGELKKIGIEERRKIRGGSEIKSGQIERSTRKEWVLWKIQQRKLRIGINTLNKEIELKYISKNDRYEMG